MKKVLFFISFALFGFSNFAHARLCLVTHETDSAGDAYSLRYHVNLIGRDEREAPCGPVEGTLDEWLFEDEDDPAGSNQVVWFATRQVGGYQRSTGPVDEIALGSPLVFNNSSVTMVIGNAPRSFLDENPYDYDYRDDFDPTVHVPRNYGIVTLHARSGFDEGESPFTCGAGADEVVLRNFIIETNNITKDALFTRNSCLKDGGTVYVCAGILRTTPWHQPDDLTDLTQFTPEQIANAWCDQDADHFNTMEDDCNDFDEAINPDADEICGNDVDENCDGNVNEGCACMPGDNRDCGFPNVGECEPGTQKCGADGQWGECVGGLGPTPEICGNEADENCDGALNDGCVCDPGADRPCGSAIGACEEGTETCADDGLSWGACTGAVGPAAETCDGVNDEDCDGTVDEGCFCTNGTTRDCGSTDIGACTFGSQTCFAGAWGACIGAVEPVAEVCDGVVDDDCDGPVDDGCVCTNGATRPCGSTDMGSCAFGTETCADGAWASCVGAIGPVAEICGNAEDENCDGVLSDGCVCDPGEERPCGPEVGACTAGTETCAADGLSWGACLGGVGPAAEVCDTLDNDCDGATDEADAVNPTTWYADGDVDTYGNPAVTAISCARPDGFVANDDDCDDTNDLINPRAAEVCGNGLDDDCDGMTDELPTWYADLDGDSYGNPNVAVPACLAPGGFVVNDDDCDDASPSINPGATEICDDGVDQNCDGTDPICPPPVDTDNDGDGFCVDVDGSGVCEIGGTPGDCNDSNAAINPAAVEMCDGVDNNCNGLIDEASAADATTWYADIDGDTYGNPAFSILSCSRILRFVPDFTDCNDSSAGINPGAIEICDDAIDQDCSGRDLPCTPAADTDDDGDGFCEDSNGDGTCTDGARPGDCDDTKAAINPDATEICDGIDNNCDRIVDLVLADNDGDSYFSSCPRDCVDSNGMINPAAVEICGDGLDNNCDGMDTACPEEPDDEEDDEEEPEDKDDDDFTVDFDCNDLNRNVNPGAAEICDGIDNNCDGLVDFADPDGDGFFGPCPIDCNNADGTIYPGAMEICFDDIDNNCNEVTDEGCVIEPPTIDCTNPAVAVANPAVCTVSEPPVEPTEPDDQEIVPPGGFPVAIEGGGGCGLSAVSASTNLLTIFFGLLPLAIMARKRRTHKHHNKIN